VALMLCDAGPWDPPGGNLELWKCDFVARDDPRSFM
jgi:hypothetical protein